MISVVIPTFNAEPTLAASFAALVSAAVDGLVREVIVVDGGSSDGTLDIADACGADVLKCAAGRGRQLMLGAAHARCPWLLFLHADTVLDHGWDAEARTLIEETEMGRRAPVAAAFRFAVADLGWAPRVLEGLVGFRCAAFKAPYGDQGLLIPRRLYDEVGGFRALPLMEDVDLIRRLGRSRVAMLRSLAVTSAARFRRDGYVVRVLRNKVCVALFLAGAPMAAIQRLYEAAPADPPAPLGRSRPAE